jgi:hypothetical protein
MRKYSAVEASGLALAGKIHSLPSGSLLTFLKINTQGKDGLSSHHIIRIGMSTEAEWAPWLPETKNISHF